MKITVIAAADDENGIGREGELPWECPEDLAFFKRRTLGRPVIMGSDTIRSLPEGGLPGRSIIALGRSVGGATCIEEALERAAMEAVLLKKPEIMIGGGASVYEAALPYAHAALITRIPGTHDCDRFLPDMKRSGWYRKGSEEIRGAGTRKFIVEVHWNDHPLELTA